MRLSVILALVFLIAPVSAGMVSLPDTAGIPGLFITSGNSDLNLPEARHIFRYNVGSGNWMAENAGQDTTIRVTVNGDITLTCRNGSFGMQLAAVGRDTRPVPANPGVIGADGRVLEIRRTGYTEWYLNRDDGIEQGMTLLARPEGDGRVQVLYGLSGDLTPSLEWQTLLFSGRDGPVFKYSGLIARDTAGRVLPTRMLLSGTVLTWEVDDTGARYPVTIDPMVTQAKILTSSDGKVEDHFGTSIDVSGDTVIVGAPNADIDSTDKGQAYVFSMNYGGTGNWGQIKILNASDGASGDCFGQSVAVDGSTAVVGGICAGSDHTGQVYVFYQDYLGANNWSEVKILTASDKAAGAYFGTSVDIEGTTVIVGAPHADAGAGSTNQGQAYLFSRDKGGLDTWGQVAILNASDRTFGDNFGKSVSISGVTAVIGADNTTVSGKTGQGKAYVFSKDMGGSGNWGQVTGLTAPDGEADAMFGNSVAVDGSTAVIGAFGSSVSGSNTGEAYVFSKDTGGLNNWGLVKNLTASDKMGGDRFGYAVAVSGIRAVVGAPVADSDAVSTGKAYLFSQNLDGADNWGQEQILQASDREESGLFGFSIAANGSTIVTGAENATVSGKIGQGKAYVFTTPAPTPTPRPDGGSDGPAPVQHVAKSPLQKTVSTISVNVGQIGRTPIVRVEVTGVEVKDTVITATEADGPGTGVPPPPGIVYEYVDVSPARFTEITDAKIVFVVPLSWIFEHYLTPQEIVLYHHDGKMWEALPTTLMEIRDGEAYYTAEGSGFSRFAITGQLNSTQPGQNVTPQRTVQILGDLAGATGTGTPGIKVSSTTSVPVVTGTTAPLAVLPSPDLPFATIALAVAAIVILAVGIFLIRRWWIRRQNPALFEK
ncbi:PGF-pre-PGF domain-containing protein [Methanoregula sp.]|uniref:PGF-pre-PGF domain-containing protein n=1 Tax=Methanoregula sp. TaxID=2052170 RepID=UPI003563B0D7